MTVQLLALIRKLYRMRKYTILMKSTRRGQGHVNPGGCVTWGSCRGCIQVQVLRWPGQPFSLPPPSVSQSECALRD